MKKLITAVFALSLLGIASFAQAEEGWGNATGTYLPHMHVHPHDQPNGTASKGM
ncbi:MULTISPECIES: hypothetical protein [Silvimonas]|uniref:hypothetical protein n=1 Tax=Silvimonas TaxID=300264 RepID=UPI0024B3C6BB|nr:MULTISPECIES: hypothetical protein [Silvimonas]MDR3428138.1 hypothetical protein [Silvimonas sp.]